MPTWDDNGTPMTPAEWDEWFANQPFRNGTEESYARAAGVRFKAEYTGPMVADAMTSLIGLDGEAGDHRAAASEVVSSIEGLKKQIRSRTVTAAEARKLRGALVREASRLEDLYESMVAQYERDLYTRDHAEDVVNRLFEKYPPLRESRRIFPV